MKIAILSPIAWRTPPTEYGPWEQMASIITEGLVDLGHEVTLFATGDSITSARLDSVCPKGYAEDPSLDAKVWEALHISNLIEKADQFDVIHNHFDFLPLSYSRLIETPMVTTIHGFSSSKILPVYEKYNNTNTYISISDADRSERLKYERTIYHGIDPGQFTFRKEKEEYLLYFGRIHPDKGTHTAIEIAKKANLPLKIAGLIQDENYYKNEVFPHIDNERITYLGNVNATSRDPLLGKAKCLLHPIYFDEPFGLSVAEAMMCGTPVIAFNRGSMPELIENGKNGYLVKTADEATQAISNLHKIDSENCRRRALNLFHKDRMVDSYVEVYHKVLTQSSISAI
ncbi:glycosyltransferase family 4 protein [Leeuwenhoekiella sp. A16]|uniref:glycosyltransferase family 4 protein n=1 Tax=unclassified Leeuwenhoekiella TaxID=2615029 RepID=UPI003A7F8FF0